MYLCVRGHVFVCVRGIDFAYVYDFDKKLGLPTPEFNPRLILCFIFLWFFVLFCYVSVRSESRVVMSVTISAEKRCSVRLFLQLFIRVLMSYLR